MKPKMLRRLVLLASGLTLCAAVGGGYYVHRKLTIRREYAACLAEGLDAAAKGDNAHAADLLQRYLQHDPDRVDALTAYVHLRPLVPLPKNLHIAYTIYSIRHLLQVDGRKPHPEEQRELLDLYVQTRYWAEALLLSQELLPDTATPTAKDAP